MLSTNKEDQEQNREAQERRVGGGPGGRGQEIIAELRSVLAGKQLDALLPPLFFVVSESIWGLGFAAIAAPGLALIAGLRRIWRGQNWYYAAGGLVSVSFAAALAFYTRSAAGFFLPAIAGSAGLLILVLLTQLLGRPAAAWASHLTRGWPLPWFWRSDVRPAYSAVTWFWAAYLALRLVVQVALYLGGSPALLAWGNFLLGWPGLVLVLILTYLYGIHRLRILGGPGVEEFMAGTPPPWKGQTRGF